MNRAMKAAIILPCRGDARSAISAAKAFGASDIEVWAFGPLTDEIRTLPVKHIISVAADGDPVAERYMAALTELAAERAPDVFLFAEGSFAGELAAQFACETGVSCAISITGIRAEADGDGLIITRRVYGMQLEAEIAFRSPPYVFSLAKGSFAPAEGDGKPEIIETSAALTEADWYTDGVVTKDTDEKNLRNCETVLVGGRGLGSAATAQKLEELGDMLGIGVGGTRPAILSAWLPYEHMVGLSGTIINPKLCVTFGASGCGPFVKGIEKSEITVAINKDPDAMIFKHCDIGLIADCGTVIDTLISIAQGES